MSVTIKRLESQAEMTIKEIAKQLGYSTTTVSVCLAHREKDPRYKILPEKAEQIREYARSCGYTPNLNAKKLRQPGSNLSVGLLFRERAGMERQFHSMNRVITKLSELNINYQVLTYRDRFLSEALSLLKGLQVNHVISFSPLVEPCIKNHPNTLQRINAEASQKVDQFLEDWKYVETLLNDMTLYSVNYLFPTPASGGIKKGLIRMGTDIGRFMRSWIRKINESGQGPVVVASWCGEEEQMLEEGLLSCKEHILYPSFDLNRYEEGLAFGEHLCQLYKKHPFRTVFVGNDGFAAGIMTVLLDRGFRIPEDIGVLGFGDDDGCCCFRVPLSTFDCNMARNALEIVDGIASHKTSFKDKEEDFTYIERTSFRMKTP